MKNSVESVIKNSLCTGCGICQSVCPQAAIELLSLNGMYVPQIDHYKCHSSFGCNLCYRICPGHSLELNRFSKKLYPESEHDEFLGHLYNCYTGFTNDHGLRYHSASGGLLTQTVLFLLEKKRITGAVVTRFTNERPLVAETILATCKEDICLAKSSKYCPVTFKDVVRRIKSCSGKVAIVGLPCHIHALRKLELTDNAFREKVLIYLGIYCSSTKNYMATEYIIERLMKTDIKNVKSFVYRDEGCMGFTKVVKTNGSVVKAAFRDMYHPIRSFFIPYRCTLCIDHTAELADISYGDIQIPEFWEDRVGINSVITRKKESDDLLVEMAEEGIITLDTVPASLVVKSQKPMLMRKKRHIVVRRKFLSVFHRKLPNYDVEYKSVDLLSSLKYFMATLILYTEIEIGKRRFLWWWIGVINKVAKWIR